MEVVTKLIAVLLAEIISWSLRGVVVTVSVVFTARALGMAI